MSNKYLTVFNNIQNRNYKKNHFKKFSKDFQKVISEVVLEINNREKTLSILNKKFKLNFVLNDLKKFEKFNTVALIGMGGSILGAEAIYNFLEEKIKKKFYFFNDLNEKRLINLKNKKNLSKILFVIISKSGSTIETLTNTFLLNILKKNSKNIIIISENKNNLLLKLSKKLNIFYIEHKNYIGGRFSVLSEVGLLPAYLMGTNISDLKSNVGLFLNKKDKIFLKDSTTKIASLLTAKKFNNLILINYVPELEKFLYWCQQLIAESLGKKNKGFLPVISNVPKDHHSLLQLYLDGPKDKFFNIFSFDKQSKMKINLNKNIGIKSFLNEKNLNTIKIAQKNALIKTFRKKIFHSENSKLIR